MSPTLPISGVDVLAPPTADSTPAVAATATASDPSRGPLCYPRTCYPFTLPESGEARPLTPADFEVAARELGVETAAIRAVARVESGGRVGFDAKKRPIIRYENHYFRRLTKRKYDKSHPDLSNSYGSTQYKRTHRLGGMKGLDAQWDLLKRAFALAPEAAVRSCSWGMFQVMGDNASSCGWPTLQQFVNDMFASEYQHLRAFLAYCRANNLVRYLKSHQWASFALRYNGKAYRKNRYDTKMATYYALYKRG